MKYGFKNNIRVLWRESSPESGGSPKVIPKTTEWGILNWLKNLASWLSETSLSELKDIALSILEAEKSDIQEVRETYKILKATGAIPEISVGNIKSLIGRWMDWSWASWLRAVLSSLNNARKGNISIVTYSNKQYQSYSMDEYDAIVSSNPESVNTSVVKWLLNLYKTSDWSNSNISFKKETWENISIYAASKNWETKIIGTDRDIAVFLWTTYGEKKIKEEEVLMRTLNTLLPGIQKNDPRLAELLKKSNLERNPNGSINATKAIEKMKFTKINEVPQEFRNIADKMKKDAKELFQKAKEIAKSIPVKSLSEINIPWIGKWEVLNRPLETLSESEITKYTPIIETYLNTIKDPKKIDEIKKILTVLISRKEGFEKTRLAADANDKEITAQKEISKNPNITPEQLWLQLNSVEAQKNSIFAQEVAVSRTESNDQLDTLKEHGINTLEKAQSKLQELEKKWELSREEQILKSKLSWYIQSKIREAQVYNDYGAHLTETDKQEIFSQTNRFISNNPTEQYNFQALEKIATLTDPESSEGKKSVARLEVWQSILMSKALEGEMTTTIANAPELNQVNISKNQDWTYNIPLFDAKNISKEQVTEYKESTKLYAELGLSQMIPHIPLLTQELRNKWINTAIDGQVSTTEQQQILKALYAQLFWKEIISSSLGEVEQAFSSALGNPTSMKSAMQSVLKTHRLISDSGQPIASDTLQNWMRKNTQDNQKPSINLT